MTGVIGDPDLPPRLRAILDAEDPRFSDSEMARRRAALEDAMAAAGVDHAVLYGAGWRGGAVAWLTHWPVTTEAVAVVTPGEPVALFIQYYNHVPQAKRIARDCAVSWGGAATARTVADALHRRGAVNGRVGLVGPVPFAQHAALAGVCRAAVDMNAAYTRLRLVKSAEEIDWLRIGATLSDMAIAALAAGLRPGLSEHALADLVERAYVPWGGTTGIHFFGVTPMRDPSLCVPAQIPSTRPVRRGDVVFCEISAAFRDYSGQVLRTFAVAEAPPSLYRDLHEVAARAFESIAAALRPGVRPEALVAAAALIEEAGYSTCDDLVHGYGGGYLPPVVAMPGRPRAPLPDMTLEPGMMVVVQPNVITRDGRAGVQTGELMLVTEDGADSLHRAPRGLVRVDPRRD
jgi:Xaa-Pro aminopeptidase